MSEFSISSPDFEEGGEIPKKFGHMDEDGNTMFEAPEIKLHNVPAGTKTTVMIMDDPDAMAVVGRVWVHWLEYTIYPDVEFGVSKGVEGLNDFGTLGYNGPAPPDKRHTYIFKMYALDTDLDLKESYQKPELEDAMKGHIIAEAKLTGTYEMSLTLKKKLNI